MTELVADAGYMHNGARFKFSADRDEFGTVYVADRWEPGPEPGEVSVFLRGGERYIFKKTEKVTYVGRAAELVSRWS